ncbi:MAG: hypothetical protein ACMG6S_25430 [Byssovorax sp.]
MWPFVFALQLGEVAPPQQTNVLVPPAPPQSQSQSTPVLPIPPPPPPPPMLVRPLPSGFARVQVGFGPPAFSPETSLLRLEGYGGGKIWIEIDGGYMTSLFGRHVGGGLWCAIGQWISPGGTSSPSLSETDYLVGLEIPVRFGSRDLALLAAPRVGIAHGSPDLGGDVRLQSGFVWGAQASAVSSRYHLSASVTFLSAVVEPPGAVGRPHDLGGLYFSVGGLLDDG